LYVGIAQPFPRDWDAKEFRGTQQSDHAPRSGLAIKIEEVMPKMAHRSGSDTGKSKRRWLDRAVETAGAVRSIPLPFILHRSENKKGCDRGSKVAHFTASENEKCQFL